MVQLTLAPVRNENLFAKHYLEERLRNLPEWEEEDEIENAFGEIKDLWEQEKDLVEDYNEAQLEDNFIKKIFEILNHSYGIQETVRENALRPDYGFFESNEDRKEAHKQKNVDDFYKTSIAIGDAKKWGISLDKKTKSGRVKYERSNPSWQIYVYLKETPAKWGILTNGEKWRLYNEQTSDRLDTYYEIDLPTILENSNREEALQEFKYFYLFFRQTAFLPAKESFLDKIFEQSEKYSQKIGENLEESVYKSLLWMTKGYFDMGTNNLEKNKENVKKVHDNSLIFLYRLLFLLYAESKDMLGTEIPKKYESDWSFSRWVDDILKDIDNNQVNPKGGLYHYRLKSIFRLIREGSESIEDISSNEFYVPAYNGGLFSQEEYPFLKQKKIQDGYLAKVVDLLVRAPSAKEGQKGRIDYSDLSLRHLGGIYEGLLEYKPKLADEDMVAEKKKGTLKWVPASESKKDFSEFNEDKKARKGELYLVTDKGERKATGSYYTPDYIVKYIVENTLGPVIEEKLEDAETDEEKRKAILSTNVLDPAMGSGHFLVEAVDFLASRLVEFAKNGGEKRDIDWAKRKVARNCIYGVDVNPLATELAKVSLWLNTMAEDKPLSFLDHHLKTGNSLIGADIHELDKHPEEAGEKTKKKEKNTQLALSDFFGEDVREDIKQLLGEYKEMLEITEKRPEDIKEQEQLFQKFEEHPFKKKFDVLADVKTSYYFGNEFSKSKYEKLLDAFRSGDGEWKKITEREWVKKASDSVDEEIEGNLSDEKKFFHWKLEFPEVFFNIRKGVEKDNPGFDAVVGNPPYVSIENLQEEITDYMKKTFESTEKGRTDIYIPFIELSDNLTSQGSFQSMIVPDKWLISNYGEKLRKNILENRQILSIWDLRTYNVFKDVSNSPIVYCIRKSEKSEKMKIKRNNPGNEEVMDYFDQDKFKEIPDSKIKLNLNDKRFEIVKKFQDNSVEMREFCYISFGCQPGSLSNFVFENKKEAIEKAGEYGLNRNSIKRFIRGRNVRRYTIDYSGDYLVYAPDRLHRPAFPELFEQNKIIFSEINSNIRATFDKEGYYGNEKAVFLVLMKDLQNLDEKTKSQREILDEKEINPRFKDISLKGLTGLVNSTLSRFYFAHAIGDLLNVYPEDIRKVRIKDSKQGKKTIESLQKQVEAIQPKVDTKRKINLNIQDYLGNYDQGPTLKDLYTPVEGLSDTILYDTAADKDSLKIGRVGFEKKEGELLLNVSVRYKPDNKNESENLDRWGYTETDLIPAMKFSGNEKELVLIQEFTKLAVDEAGGFANFREKATKTKSLIDRLEELTLPKLEDVKSGLEKYLEQKEKAEKLEKEIQETDNLIDAIVFDLYDLNEEEVITVLDSLGTEKDAKQDILEKFRGLNE